MLMLLKSEQSVSVACETTLTHTRSNIEQTQHISHNVLNCELRHEQLLLVLLIQLIIIS